MSDLFIKVVNMSISASWLALAVLVLRFIFKKAPKWVNPILWGLVGIRLILPFSIESALSLIPSAETISPEIMYAQRPTISSGIYSLNSTVNPIISESFAPDPSASANPLQIWIPIAAGVWIIGMAIMLIYTAVSYFRLNRRVKTAVLVRDNIFQSENVASPFVLGLLHPRIYLPFDIDEEAMYHVIAHEQTHIKRHDHWIKPLGFLLLTLYWFNPVLWVAYVLLCRDIELACDERVVREMDMEQRADYSQALLSCSVSRKMIAACPLAFGEVGVKARVKNVLNYRKPAFGIIVVSVVSCIVAAVCFLTNPKSDAGEPDLSFLNYSNAISLVADREALQVIYCPPTDSQENASIQIGEVDGAKLANYLDWADWDACRTPRDRLSSPGSVEFVIEDDYRITVYKRKKWSMFRYAVVEYGDEVRYYRTDRDDYEDAVAILKGQNEDDIQWDTRPSIKMDGANYIDPYMPVSQLPHGYEFVGKLSEEQANDTGLTGGEYYMNPKDPDSFYVYQECGTPIDINTVDTEQRQWAYKRWIREGSNIGRMLTLDDVIMLSVKGMDLTWEDFERYSYIETGSGLYIQVYEIDEMFSVMIGGGGKDFMEKEPMYIYLMASDGLDEKTDIRTDDVQEFIDRHKNNPVVKE